jgi:hypothetical protein
MPKRPTRQRSVEKHAERRRDVGTVTRIDVTRFQEQRHMFSAAG